MANTECTKLVVLETEALRLMIRTELERALQKATEQIQHQVQPKSERLDGVDAIRAYCGIGKSTYRKWLETYPAFRKAVKEAGRKIRANTKDLDEAMQEMADLLPKKRRI